MPELGRQQKVLLLSFLCVGVYGVDPTYGFTVILKWIAFQLLNSVAESDECLFKCEYPWLLGQLNH